MTDKPENILDTAPVSIWPTVWKYSFILAACSFAYTLILYYTGLAAHTGAGLLSFVITIVLLVLGMRKYRSVNNGYMTFGKATITGILISIIASVLSSVLNAVYLAFIDNSVLAGLSEKTLQKLQETPGLTQQQIDMMMKLYQNLLFTPVGMLITGIISGIIGGVIISLILAAILKKEPPITG